MDAPELDHTRQPISFVITAWLEPRRGEGQGEWRYHVRHIQSGREARFTRLGDLLAFLGQEAGVEPALPLGGPPGKGGAVKVTDCLVAEHQVLLRQMEHLQGVVQNPLPSAEALRAAIDLFHAGLEGHAALEEEVLFPALEPHLGREYGPLAVMYAEHEDIRSTLGQVATTNEEAQLRALLSHLLEVLGAHFAKEEQVLFPMAENLLPAGELEGLGERCALHHRPPPL